MHARTHAEGLEPRTLLSTTPGFTWSMPPRYGLDTNSNGIIDLPNSRAYASPKGFTLNLDASPTTTDTPITQYQWALTPAKAKRPKFATGPTPQFTDLPQGTYTVKLTTTDSNNVSATTTQSVQIRDVLIVSLGDSYASGEGNPQTPLSDTQPALWADGLTPAMTRENLEAHRSSVAPSSQAALQLEQSDPHFSVTYINLAQTGASILHGMLGSQAGSVDSHYKLPPEIAELKKIVGSRHIDFLTLSIGGNDLGFTTAIAELLLNGSSDLQLPSLTTIGSLTAPKLAVLPGLFKKLNAALNPINIRHRLITAYPDFTRDAAGNFTAFGSDVLPGAQITTAGAQFASENILAPLNAAIATSMQANTPKKPWQFLDTYLPDFLPHGYASTTPWFRTETQARQLQGSEQSFTFSNTPIPISEGGFHPNAEGNADIAQALLSVIQPAIAS